MKAKKNIESDFFVKVVEGMKLVSKRLIEDKIAKNQSVVIMKDGKIIKIKASDLIKL